MSKACRASFASLMAAVGVLSAALPAQAAPGGPPGYRLVRRVGLTRGVEHLTYVRSRPAQVINVARIAAGAEVSLAPVVARPGLGAGRDSLEPVAESCRRVRCLAAVNADYWLRDIGQPVGGVVASGVLHRSPAKTPQASIDKSGRLSVGTLPWSARLVASDLRHIDIGGLNVPPRHGQFTLYSPAYGGRTGTRRGNSDLVLRIVKPRGALRLDQTTVVALVGLRQGSGNAAIPRDGLVLSGHGAAAKRLLDLWNRYRRKEISNNALLRLETTPFVATSVGGGNILVRSGRVALRDNGSTFFRAAEPRTMMGQTGRGDLLLVTVDGRQPGYAEGLRLLEAAQLMVSLGARDAINLDGGGSTTFVVGGQVVNRPSDAGARRVKETLAIVAGKGRSVRLFDPLAMNNLWLSEPDLPPVPFQRIELAAAPSARPGPWSWPAASAVVALLSTGAAAWVTRSRART